MVYCCCCADPVLSLNFLSIAAASGTCQLTFTRLCSYLYGICCSIYPLIKVQRYAALALLVKGLEGSCGALQKQRHRNVLWQPQVAIAIRVKSAKHRVERWSVKPEAYSQPQIS